MAAREFKTFLNIIEDPQAALKYQRFAAGGVQAFGAIEAAARAASQATTGMLRGSAAQASGATSRALQDQANQARAVARASQEMARTAEPTTMKTRALGAASRDAARDQQVLSRSLSATATALNVVQGPLGPVAGRFGAAARAITSLSGAALGAASIGALAFTVARLGNQYQTLEGRLRPYTTTQTQTNAAMANIITIARESRAALEPVADLYIKLTQSASQYGFTQQRIARLTRTATQAAVLSGGTSQSQAAGLYQFAQGIASNRLGGDELRSILEQIPQLADAIAKGLGVTTGQLREMGAQGELTARQIADALDRSASQVEERFSRLPLTLNQAITGFSNSLVVVIGRFDQAVGISRTLATTLQLIADNMEIVVTGAVGLAAVVASVRLNRWLTDIESARVQAVQLQRAFEGVTAATVAQAEARAVAAAADRTAAATELGNAQNRIALIRAEIAALAERRAANLAVLTQGPFAPGGGQFNRAAYRAAQQEELILTRQIQIATQDLARAKAGEAVAKGAATAATQANTVAQAELNAVQNTGIGAGGRWAGVLAAIRGILNPTTLLVTGLAIGVTYLATRQSAAERATNSAREAMEAYGRVVDETTGRVRQLSDAERERNIRIAQEAIAEYETGSGRDLRQELRTALNRAAATQSRADPEQIGGGGYQIPAARRGLFDRLSRQLVGTPAEYSRAITEITRMANSGDQAMQRFLRSTEETRDALGQAADAARASYTSIEVERGGTDPAARERRIQQEAALEAAVDNTTSAINRQTQAENTLNDQARRARAREDVYREFRSGQSAGGANPLADFIRSPQEIQQMYTRLRNLRDRAVVPGQEGNRAGALNALREEITQTLTVTNRYRGTIEALTEARVRAQTAERDASRQQAATRRGEVDAEQQARATLTAALNTQLLALEQRRATIGERAYVAQRVQLLQTYDRERDAIEERVGASQRGTTALIEDARRAAREFEQLDDRRSQILGRYTDEPRGVQRGAADIRILREAQAQLGEGFYPRAVLEQDIRNIEYGVRRPIREMLRDQERNREVQLLIVQGREAEAEALRRTYQLVDQIGEVSAQEYQTVLRNIEAEQRLNDVLASRQRITSLIQGTVDEVRSSLERFLIDVRQDAPRAAGDLARNMLQRFQQIQVRGFVERITAGADERVRSLLSGRNAVDTASRTFATQISDAGGATRTLADRMREAAGTISQAADEIRAAGTRAQQAVTLPTGEGAGGAVGLALQETLRLPFARSGITSGFGRRAPFMTMSGLVSSSEHGGLDFGRASGARAGAPFPAALSGTVVAAGWRGGYGNAVELEHGGGLRTLYAHLGNIAVSLGRIVRRGESVGTVGSTGSATAAHGHFETRLNGRPVNPLSLLEQTFQVPGATIPAPTNARSPARLADIEAIINALPSDAGGGDVDDIAAASLAAMRRRSTQLAATALGAYETVSFAEKGKQAGQGAVPSARETFNAIGSSVGAELDEIFGTDRFFKKIGGSVGTAFEGAGRGALASSIAGALGIKQSNTAAQIGGALGAMTGIPGMDIIAGLTWGTIGGMLKKAKTGSATFGLQDFGGLGISGTSGSNRQRIAAAEGLAGNVISSLDDIARTLGGTVGAFGNISIGMRDDTYRVDPSGRGVTKTKKGAVKFETEQEAIAYALELAISRGAIQGITAASQRILQSGQDLQRAIEKAVIIESIPRRLLQRTDPVRFAVEELNREFSYMISVLKEAGASGQQFADAQKLYELERADAIEQATATASSAIQDFLNEMTGGGSSPLNKRTIYANARAELEKFTADITAGKVVDEGKLLTAARNVQDASRALYGSGGGFFADFDYIFDLLTKAKSNLGAGAGTGTGELPGSPFAGDPVVEAAIASASGQQIDAINNQTQTLGGILETISWQLGQLGAPGNVSGGLAIDWLPGLNPIEFR